MNKLEELRDKINIFTGNIGDIFEVGFDAAIALDLPVKFAEWIDEKCYTQLGQDIYWYEMNDKYEVNKVFENSQELYQYWIDNIFKIE